MVDSQEQEEFIQLFDQDEPRDEEQVEKKFIEIDLSLARPFAIVPTPRRFALDSLFESKSGLSKGQYRSNSWGFPPIPIPDYRSGNGIYRGAPKNATEEFLGHPIYWIHPDLTKLRNGETDESWSLRMFYLILGFGYWDDSKNNLSWINYPLSKGVQYDFLDIQSYRQPGNPKSALDAAGMMTESDLKVPLSRIEEITVLSLQGIRRTIEDELRNYITVQSEALATTFGILGIEPTSDDTSDCKETGDSVWYQEIESQLIGALTRYDESIQSSNVGNLIEEISEITEKASIIFTSIDHIISVLTLPVLKTLGIKSDSYAKIIAVLNISIHKDKERVKHYDFSGYVEKLFSTEAWEASFSKNTAVPPSVEFWRILQDHHTNSIDRLRLALINYLRSSNDKKPYESYEDMRASLLHEEMNSNIH